MTHYVALLRGINVGGRNLIRMTDLKACFEAEGFEDVSTYIQSGNVLFAAQETSAKKLEARLEKVLSEAFGYEASLMLRSREQLRRIIDSAPRGFGSRPKEFRYDVIFLKDPLKATTAMKSVVVKPGVDTATPGHGVLYFSRLIAQATQSRLSRIVGLPIYQQMTIRNWNTTTKLLERL